MIKHFLSLSSFSASEILTLIHRAQYFFLHKNQPESSSQLLQHRILANVFFEASTRTRCSFEIAAKRLGAEVVNFMPESSSLKKGETIYDTVKTLEQLGAGALVIRHRDDYIFEDLRSRIATPLINAGAGTHEHPSQCLLDLLTLHQEFGQLDGLRLVICGDIKHSRVANSMIGVASELGIALDLCGPASLLPNSLPAGARITPFDEAISGADAVMMLRIQLERHDGLNLDAKSYRENFGLTVDRSRRLKSSAIVMHPGPFNRGVELDDAVVESDPSRIFKQMGNGVFARMAILEWAMGRR